MDIYIYLCVCVCVYHMYRVGAFYGDGNQKGGRVGGRIVRISRAIVWQ